MADRLRPGDRVYMAGTGFGHGTVRRTGWDGEGGQQLMVEVEWDCSPGVFSAPFVRDLLRSEEVIQARGETEHG